MRPRRVELEGFSAFRGHTVVSFDDVDLFALVGPTGSGKSSVIDAITFALYGKVARFHDDRMVGPIIHAQASEARVRLDFELDGVTHTAVRVVRRQKDRATTREARLEREGEVLAGDARSLDAAIEAALGLSFEQFTKTVVLPQGEFAAFLHATPKERGDLLVRLLDFGIYGHMASAARARAAAAATEVTFLEQQLGDLGPLDPDAEPRARARAAALRALGDALHGTFERIAAIDRALAEREAARAQTRKHRARLAALAVPDAARAFDDQRRTTSAALEHAAATLIAARSRRDAAHQRVREGPDGEALRAVQRDWQRAAELVPLVDRAHATLAVAQQDLAARDTAVAAAQTALDAVTLVLDAARQRAGAAALRHDLHVGEPCPVCDQVVAAVPAAVPEAELVEAQRAHRSATAVLDAARAAHTKATRAAATAEAQAARRADEHQQVCARLVDKPPVDAVQAQLAQADELQRALDAALVAVQQAERAQAGADRAVQDLAATEQALRRQFHAARDALVALEPPAAGEAGVLADWHALVGWAEGARRAVDAELDAGQRAHDALAAERTHLEAGVVDTCGAHGVDGRQPRLAEHLATLAARADNEADRVRDAHAKAGELRARADGLRAEQQVADDLGRLLGARGFLDWLLEEALDELVTGASDRLRELSGGQFSLLRRERDFVVRDHRNADAERSVKTLSGGETFLASLALALALADNVAALSADGAPKLESMFLDEGFGTLDPDTLDTVAAAIEELGASGRLVGVVTHIRDLADRLPVRFEVTKGATTSTIERVER